MTNRKNIMGARAGAQAAFAEDMTKLLAYIANVGWKVTFGEFERTAYQQAEYVRTGRSKTNNSRHLVRQAADLHLFRPVVNLPNSFEWISDKRLLQQFGDYWEDLSEYNRWGGNWSSFQDTPHFERRATPRR